MNQNRRSSRIIDIALTSSGIRPPPKCRQRLSFDNVPVMRSTVPLAVGDGMLMQAPDRGDDIRQVPDRGDGMLATPVISKRMLLQAPVRGDSALQGPAHGEGTLQVPARGDGTLQAFDRGDGMLKALDLNDCTQKAPYRGHGMLETSDLGDGTLQAFDCGNGTLKVSDCVEGILQAPVSGDGLLSVSTHDDGFLQADCVDRMLRAPGHGSSMLEACDGMLVKDFGSEPVNYSKRTQHNHDGVVPVVVEKDAEPSNFIPSPSNDCILLENLTSLVKIVKDIPTANINYEEIQQQIDSSSRPEDNLNSDLTLTPVGVPSASSDLVTGFKSPPNITDHCSNTRLDTSNTKTTWTGTATIEVQSNHHIPQNKKNTRKSGVKTKYIDYMSEEDEDFSTFYGNIDDSDDWSGGLSSDEESDDPDSRGKTGGKKKNIRRRKTKKNVCGQEETVGDAGLRVYKVNVRSERSKKKKSGEEYMTKKGVIVPAKKVLPNPCQGKRCGNDCGSIPEDRRENIFRHFWKLDTMRRRDWLVSLSQKVAVKRKRNVDSEKRNCTIKYSINEGEGKRNVCLQFLAATINVSDKTIYSIVQNTECGSAKDDMRGRSEPPNKTKQTTIDATIEFIKSLPAVPSHYCRQDSTRVYLPEEFKNVSNLYKLYKKVNVDKGVDVVSERIFRKILDEKFNIGFHIPKKDKCKKCLLFEKATDPVKLQEKKEHEKEKDESYARFQSHKIIHKDDPSTLCVSFDLQKVLNTPYSPSMLMYYSRKLAVYNLCFYENGTRNVFCFYWDESNGKRGSNEVGTILHNYIKSVDARGNIKRLLMYCDCCPGQNRNRTVMAMIHQTLQECDNIKTIQLNFLLTGHTYMPVDSSHAIIENQLKHTTVYAPSQWFTIFSTARKNPSPFAVERMSYDQFKKWDNIGDKYFKGNLTGKISKVRIATFKKDKQLISLKTSMNAEAKSVNVEVQSKTRVPLMSCYRSTLAICKKKHDDLRKLCTDQIIPACFHNEYNDIPRDGNVKDVLPESDIEDPDYD